jgi:hypothetical protein
MPNTYSWQFLTLECRNLESGFSKVVKRVAGMYRADNGAGVTCDQLLNVEIGALDPMAFVAFESLTAAEVQAWVEDSIGTTGLSSTQALLDTRIEDLLQITPHHPPWIT